MIIRTFPRQAQRASHVALMLLTIAWAAAWSLAAEEAPSKPSAEADAPGPTTTSDPVTARSSAARMLDFRQVIRDAKAKVFPALIYVKVVQENMEGGARRSREVSGSGVIVSKSGVALTNLHVVDKAVSVRCLLTDGRAFKAKVVGSDKTIDLAVLQLEAGDAQLPHAEFGDSDALTEGDFVMAMGAPWGLNRSVSIGIISCTRRYLPENSEYSLWLQTDAAILPGNSGGPLVSTQGRVIGINTLGIGQGSGLGFAIPSRTIQELVPLLIEKGEAPWSWLGLQLQPLRDFNRNIYFDADHGVVVAGLNADSPSRRAGLQPRDRIVAVDDQPLTATTEEDLPDVRRRLGLLPQGKPVTLTLFRGDQEMQIELTPRRKGSLEGEAYDAKRWDFTAKAINQFENANLYFHRKQGVFIFGVEHPGNAAAAGLQAQDIILTIDGKPIQSLDDLKAAYDQAIENIDQSHRLRIRVLRNGLLRQAVLSFARDFDKE